MKLIQRKTSVVIVAVVLLHVALIFLIGRRFNTTLGTQVGVPETSLAREVRVKIKQTSKKSVDELIENMGDDWVNLHSQLYIDDGRASSWFFDAVVADPNNMRLIFEIQRGFSGDRRSDKVLEVFDRYFNYYWDGLYAQAQAKEEVSRVLREQGKQQLTLADFHSNRHIGISKFPEGWSEISERTNAILNATFLVATFCSFDDVGKSIRRFLLKQREINARLQAIGYPDIEHDSVGLEQEFLVSILWYSSDPERVGDSSLAKSIRRIIDKAVESKKLQRYRSEMVGWEVAVKTYDSKGIKSTSPSDKESTPVDRFRWSCSDMERNSIAKELLDCIP